MTKNLKIKLAQLNFIVGDLVGNTEKIIKTYQESVKQGLDLIVFSELCLTGYPPEDLLYKKYFITEIEHKINEICKITANNKTALIIGAPASFSSRYGESSLYNCALFIADGLVQKIIPKSTLPNYGVFDEKRYFKQASSLTTYNFRDFNLAILVCEDIWNKKNAFLLESRDLDAIISIHASPFSQNKIEKRHEITKEFIKNIQKPLIYVNQVGGQDGIVFDGSSFVLNAQGEIVVKLKEFGEDEKIVELDFDGIESSKKPTNSAPETDAESLNLARIYNCCILGIRDYFAKNGFKKALIGMSGGMDSALCAAMAVDALGPENVKLVALPSKFSSKTSLDDANLCSSNLGVKLEIVSIEEPIVALEKALHEQFKDSKADLTEENMQSRIRGNILMALSNKFGHLLLTTGNKSEMAVGYATIYGDMCGGLNPLKDIYKTEVYKLAAWRNSNVPELSYHKKINLIPQNILTKEPTAELRENQKDSDSLPEYEILDKILFNLIESQKSIAEIISLGFNADLVKKVAKLLYNSEHKRRQAVIGIKISKMSFDKDRRYPITNKFCY